MRLFACTQNYGYVIFKVSSILKSFKYIGTCYNIVSTSVGIVFHIVVTVVAVVVVMIVVWKQKVDTTRCCDSRK